MLTHAISPLADEVEEVINKVIGCALAVHTTLAFVPFVRFVWLFDTLPVRL
jgi:hypothetical protein